MSLLTNYFTISELTASDTAVKKHIDNTPSPEVVRNINELISFLNPIREAWGSPLKVTSGYRSEALNKAVGGVSNSSHLKGLAVDIQPAKGTPKEFFCFLKGYLKGSKTPFDQILLEHSGMTTWCHIGYKSLIGQQRGQVKELYI